MQFSPSRCASSSTASKPSPVHDFRAILAVGLVALFFLAPLSVQVRAQQPASSSKMPAGDQFILYQNPDGEVVCREATMAERREMREVNPKLLHQITHLQSNSYLQSAALGVNSLPAHLTINLRATPQLEQNQAAKAAFIRAAQNWENQILSPVTIYIDVDFGPNDSTGKPWAPGVLGETGSPSLGGVPYQAVRNNLIVSASTSYETSIYNALPNNSVPTDMGDAITVSISSSIARALGFLDPTAQPGNRAAHIGFNSGFSYDFDPNDGIDAGKTDFDAVATHEIGHALGFVSNAGSSTPTPAIWDLFRFRTGTTISTFTTAQRVMTVGGPDGPSSGFLQYYFVPGSTELGLSTGGERGYSTHNSDGWQSSHWKHNTINGGVYIGIMDPAIPSGLRRQITVNDTNALNKFGYNRDNSNPPPPPPPPPANDNFANAQIISGCTGSVAGTNLGATQEADEPNSPDSSTSTKSVWYQWQAPGTGSVTMTTAGSGFDTVLAVYAGSSLTSLGTAVAHNDDIPDFPEQPHDVTSSVTFTASAGTVYRIAINGYDNDRVGGDIGNFVLNWSGCTFQPTTLTNSQVEIKTWTFHGRTYAYAKLLFPNVGYRLANFGEPVKAGNDFSADVAVEKFAGTSVQAVTTTAQIYDLGALADGNYTFTFKNSGTVVKSQAFTVSSATPPPNSIDNAGEFVKQQYRDFLNREADPAGENFWTDNITLCSDPARRPLIGQTRQTEAECTLRQRETTSGAFFLSPEFQYTGYFVYRMYQGALARQPKLSEFIPDAQFVGAGILVNSQLSGAKINQNKADFAAQFVNCTDATKSRCAEFKAIYDTLSNQAYVDRLFQTTGVNASVSDRAALVTGLNGGTETRASVLQKVVDGIVVIAEGNQQFTTTYGQTFYTSESSRAFVQLQYFGYMKRDPDNYGYAIWLGKLNRFGGNFVNAEMVLAFISSPEYRARFGQP